MIHAVEVQTIPGEALRGEALGSLEQIIGQYEEVLGYDFIYDANSHIYVASTPDATPVGLANALPCGPREYEIAGRVVDREYRGQGIGSSMTRFILNHMGTEVSARALWSNPIDDIRVAEPLKRLGFTEERRNGMPIMKYQF
jgi:ribosomal protein S18 acetylase RimI-like enzyme